MDSSTTDGARGGQPLNDIPARQNTIHALTILAAARAFFDRAMYVATAEVLLSVGIPVLLTVLTVFLEQFSLTAALYGLILAIIEPVVFDRVRRTLQAKGARLQEQFDCDVMALPGHDSLTGRLPDQEDTREAARAFNHTDGAGAGLRDWYPPAVGMIPLSVARIICQRTNCRWDAIARARYLRIIAGAGVLVLALVVLWHIIENRTTDQLVLALAALSPMIRWLLAEWIRHSESIATNAELKGRADDLWGRALQGGMSDEALTWDSRDLQDAIYLRRKGDPAVFRWVHKWLKPRLEEQMHQTAHNMVQEFGLSPPPRP
jgi:hypothetical protein